MNMTKDECNAHRLKKVSFKYVQTIYEVSIGRAAIRPGFPGCPIIFFVLLILSNYISKKSGKLFILPKCPGFLKLFSWVRNLANVRPKRQ